MEVEEGESPQPGLVGDVPPTGPKVPKPMRQLILLIDGTGNSPEAVGPGQGPTNVQVLRDVLRKGRDPTSSGGDEGWEIYKFNTSLRDGRLVNRVVYYDRGVGAPMADANGNNIDPENKARPWWILDRLRSGASLDGLIWAAGILDNVMQAYKFLAKTYQQDDEIYMFGFSRGAYTLRLLETSVKWLGLCDLTALSTQTKVFTPSRASENQIHDILLDAWNVYAKMKTPNDPLINEFTAKLQEKGFRVIPKLPIRFFGLFDTVPGPISESVREDDTLSDGVIVARHALAINEYRKVYAPLLWVSTPGSPSQQIWFAGDHCDVGGGYAESHVQADIPLIWMLRECNESTSPLLCPEDMESLIDFVRRQPEPTPGSIDDLYALVQRRYRPPLHNSMNNKISNFVPITWRVICRRQFRRPLCQSSRSEMVHPTVWERYHKSHGGDDFDYTPSNLTRCLVALINSNRQPMDSRNELVEPEDPAVLSDADDDESIVRRKSARLLLET